MTEGMPRDAGLRARRPAHGRPGDRRHADPHRRLLAAAVLAGDRRRVHEVHAADADRDAVGVDALRAGLHPHPRRASSPSPCRSTRPARRPLHAPRRPRGPPPGAGAAAAIALLVAVPLAYGRYGSGVEFFPERRARLRAALRARARQPLDRGEGRAGAPGRGADAWLAEHQVGLYPGRRQRGRGRRATSTRTWSASSSTSSSTGASARALNAILDELRAAMTGIPGADVEVSVPNAGPADRQGDPGAALRRRPGRPRRRRRAGRRQAARHARRDRRLRRPAGAGRRLGARGRPRSAPRSTASRRPPSAALSSS